MVIRVGIVGYGNLGRGVELAVSAAPDMELVGVFTRRDPNSLQLATTDVGVFDITQLIDGAWADRLDVLVLCGGSATDLPEQTPALAAHYNVVDSYDNHAQIPTHFAAVDAASQAGGTIAIISTGWDPGLFSLARLQAQAVLTNGQTHTFWGPGVSQGHSDAVRRIPGVTRAAQYTLPREEAMQLARSGGATASKLSTRAKHRRVCYVVVEPSHDDDAGRATIERAIVTMPGYFADYDTKVHFISDAEFLSKHTGLPHGGFVIHAGTTGGQAGAAESQRQRIEFSLQLESNPEFTAAIITAYARAAARLSAAGEFGARTVFDVAPGLLDPRTPEELRASLL